MSAFRYSPGTPKNTTYLPLCASMMSLVNKASREIAGDDASSLVMQHLWGHPSAQIPPLNFPLRYSLFSYIPQCSFLCDLVRLSWSSDPITFLSSSCLYLLYMVATALYPCFLIPFLYVIYVNVTSTASLCMSCIKYFSSYQCWLIGCHIFFFHASYLGKST